MSPVNAVCADGTQTGHPPRSMGVTAIGRPRWQAPSYLQPVILVEDDIGIRRLGASKVRPSRAQ